MNRPMAIALGLATLIAGGVLHGVYADRWGKSSALEDAAARIGGVPRSFADWTSDDQPSDAAEFAQAGAEAYWTRVYRKAGKEFLVILMVGRSGRMAVHTPEVCYRGAGYDLASPPMYHPVRTVRGQELGAVWTANFLKPGSSTGDLQLSWAWSDGGPWSAPNAPRWTFRGEPALYKLYVSQSTSGLSAEAAARNRDEFLRELLPVLNESLELDVTGRNAAAK